MIDIPPPLSPWKLIICIISFLFITTLTTLNLKRQLYTPFLCKVVPMVAVRVKNTILVVAT